jgi:predicted phage baseplate assembly protein
MPRLDNRTFDQLVAEGQVLLPRLAPGWTDHNTHDPGITLIELFAWLVEMDFYRLDRTPEASHRSFLRLVGVEQQPAKVAETVLVFALGPPGVPVHLPARFQVGTADRSVVFQTAHHLDVSSAQLTTVLTGPEEAPVDRSNENEAAGRCYLPFGSQPLPGHALYLGFDRPLAGDRTKTSLYLWAGPAAADRDTRQRLIDECKADRVEMAMGCLPGMQPVRADWRRHYSVGAVWEYFAEPGEWKPLSHVTDETRGLTLSGVVRFSTPGAGRHRKGGVKDSSNADRYFVRCRLVSGRYDCPPEIRMIAINAVPARHAMDDKAPRPFISDGRAGQSFLLPRAPVVPGSARLRAQMNGAPEGDWREELNWDRVGPHDRAYALTPETGEITFGDGLRGRVPPDGAKIEAEYQVGGGPAGNVASGSLTKILSNQPNLTVTQPLAAIGGAEAETLSEAKGRAVALLTEPQRAITLKDFEEVALAIPGVPVARAHAIADYDPALPHFPALGCVTLVVLPRCPDFRPEPGPDMLRAVARYMERRRTVTTELHVIGPSYTTVTVHARLHIEPNLDSRKAQEQARLRLDEFFHPLRGGPDATGWPIGRDVYRSEVMALLNAVSGVMYVDEVRLSVGNGSSAVCENVCVCPHGLVVSGQHQLQISVSGFQFSARSKPPC